MYLVQRMSKVCFRLYFKLTVADGSMLTVSWVGSQSLKQMADESAYNSCSTAGSTNIMDGSIVNTKTLYFDAPGNLLKYLIFFKGSGIDFCNDKLSCILYLLEKYKSKKDSELLSIASLFIEQYYNSLSLNNKNNSYYHFVNKHKIINEINNMKKFNLDKKNLLISLQEVLTSETR